MPARCALHARYRYMLSNWESRETSLTGLDTLAVSLFMQTRRSSVIRALKMSSMQVDVQRRLDMSLDDLIKSKTSKPAAGGRGSGAKRAPIKAVAKGAAKTVR